MCLRSDQKLSRERPVSDNASTFFHRRHNNSDQNIHLTVSFPHLQRCLMCEVTFTHLRTIIDGQSQEQNSPRSA